MSRTRIAIGILLILVMTATAYIPAMRGGFIWDDDSYVTGNAALRSVDGLREIWLRPGVTTQYYPLVHSSFWVEYHLWGLQPFGYHAVNVLLHALGAILLWSVLRRLSIPGAWFAAAIFALHPVHVESVAWVTERKNVLSGVFYLGALLAWFRFAHSRAGRGWGTYLLVFALFLCALLCKTVTASLPAAILLLEWWRKGTVVKRDVARTVPLFAAGGVFGFLTVFIEKEYLGAGGTEWVIPFAERAMIAGRALVFYIGKLIWPVRLTFIYPRWEIGVGPARFLCLAAVLLVLTVLFLARRRIGRGPLMAALFFSGTLFPALGFFDVYPFRYSFVADHFQYLASLGPIVLFAALAATLFRRMHADRSAPMAASLLLVLLGALTWSQGCVYHDLETLWRDTLEKNPTAWMAHINLGQILSARGETDKAVTHYREALRLMPENDKAHNNLGLALAAKGKNGEAIVHYREAIRINPRSVSAHSNLGLLLAARGQVEEAVGHYMEAIRIRPSAPELYTNLGVAFARGGRVREAERAFRMAVKLAPRDPDTHFRLGMLLRRSGREEEAAAEFAETLRLNPGHSGARQVLCRDPGIP